jgi:hypothetical protein
VCALQNKNIHKKLNSHTHHQPTFLHSFIFQKYSSSHCNIVVMHKKLGAESSSKHHCN